MNIKIAQLLVIGIPLFLYELATRLEWIDSFTFIPFTEMVIFAVMLFFNPEFFMNHVMDTGFKILASFLISAVLGILIGIILWRSDFIYHSVQPYLMIFFAIPIFSIYPVFISIFGHGRLPVIIIGILFSIVPVIINTALGFRNVRNSLVKVGKTLNLTFNQMLYYIFFPAAWPQIFTGLRLSVVYSIIGVVATEFIVSTRGLGFSIAYAYNAFDLVGMYGPMLIVISIALVINFTLIYFERKIHNDEWI